MPGFSVRLAWHRSCSKATLTCPAHGIGCLIFACPPHLCSIPPLALSDGLCHAACRGKGVEACTSR